MTPEEFWSHVDRSSDGCWPWKRATDSYGYGQFLEVRKAHRAHRTAYLLHYGHHAHPCCLHRCGNPLCCNPTHLYEGSHADNMRDMVSHGRTHRERRLLTSGDAQMIRAMSEITTLPTVAKTFGVSRSCIKKILQGKRHPQS